MTIGKTTRALAPALLLAAFGCAKDSPTAVADRCGEPGVICAAVGTGLLAFLGEGSPPLEVALYYPIDLAFDPMGRLVVLDYNNLRIRRLDLDGRVRTIMGNGSEGPTAEGTPAIDVALHHAYSIAFDAAGNMYVAGSHQPRILRVDTGGIVHVAAGGDSSGYGGDGGPAAGAVFDYPCGVTTAPAGLPLYVADTNNHRIRMIDGAGTMSTLAGTGEAAYSGDDGPGALAQLNAPYRVRYDAGSGSVYVCDTGNHVVRRIDASGMIATVAGTGVAGFSGDGGPATSARLEGPLDARIGPDGALYIADTGNSRIRRVAPDGTIMTVAGTGARGGAGDGGPALAAQLNRPAAIAFDGDGRMWIADMFNSRVRAIQP
jgi:DNA-binding beta-propeller fold protein YncE